MKFADYKIFQQINQNQINFQLIVVGSTRTYQDCERRVKKKRHNQFYIGSPFLKAYIQSSLHHTQRKFH